MTAEEVKALVEQGIENAEVRVQGSGDRFEVLVVAAAFDGLSLVRKQQRVYACINERIAAGDIHAVEIRTYTPAEWDKAQRMGIA